jgi:RHS repeat-associated protein
MPSHSCSTPPDHRLVGDPVDTLTGAVFDRKLDFRLTGPLEFSWFRHYDSSQNRRRFRLGWGQTHDFDRTLRFERDRLLYEAPIGRVFEFPILEKDGAEMSRHGYRLFRSTQRRYQLFPHGEPAMEFEFQELQQPARLRRLFQGNHQILLHYDSSRRLERINDSMERSISVVEGADGRLLSLTLEGVKGAPGQLIIAYEYDQRGNLVTTKNAAGHGYYFTYDAENRMVERRGRTGFKFRFAYDENGRCVSSTGDDHLYDLKLSYPVPRRITKVQRADGGVWTYNFDATGGLIKIRDPLGGVQKLLRDKTGQITGEVDPNGNVTRLIYDRTGAPVKKLPPLRPAMLLPEDPNAPDPRVHRVAANPAEYEYGRLLDDQNAITLPDKAFAQSLPLPYEAKRCVATRAESDNSKAAENGFKVRPLGVKWWPGPESGRIFNDLGKLVEQRDEWGRQRQWAYDPSGNVARQTDFDGGNWSYEYGPWHFLRALTNPAGVKVAYTYTTEGEVAGFTDAAGNRSEYSYDLKNRLIEVRRQGNVRDRYTRDAAGNLVAKHAGDGRLLLQFEIGPGNLPIKRVLSSGDEHTFEYDDSGRLLLAATKKDVLEFAYDDLGNCVLDMRNGRGVENRFFKGRCPGESVFAEKYITRYKRGTEGRLTITDPGGKFHEIRLHGHGLIEHRFSNRSAETSQFDNLGRCHFKYAERRDGQVWKRRYHWSGEGELRRVEDNLRGEVLHEYDAAHRLSRRVIAGRVEDYEADAADNLMRQPGLREVILQPGNRLHSVDGLGVTYNVRNHVEVRQTPAGPVRHAYDSRDQMVAVETPLGAWSAEYDALGRRSRKTWSGQTTEYFWNRDQLIAEVHADGSFRLYLYADPLAMTPLMFLDYDSFQAPPDLGRRYFIFTDQIGTPCLVEDESGAEVWRAAIEPFGGAKVVAGAKIEFNLRFPGHYFDPELGLHYNRFRYYDPRLARYLQSDPWGIAGGYNLYAYRSNPLLQVDVRGLGEENGKNGNGCDDEEGSSKPALPMDEEANTAAANAAGMDPEYLNDLRQHAFDSQELMVVRDTKPNGLFYHEDPDCVPKPHDCLLKTDPDTGLVMQQDYEPGSPQAANEQELLANKWKYDDNGVLLNPEGKAVYGDHDLQGVYKVDENGNYVKRVNTNDENWQNNLNEQTGPPPMTQHGANDNWIDDDGNRRNPGADEGFTVIEPDGTVTRLGSTAELEAFYAERGIPWPYPHYPVLPPTTSGTTLAACPVFGPGK